MSEHQGMSVVVMGNPISGFEIIGPFKQPHYATDWAGEWAPDLDWWVAPLKSQEEIQSGRVD